jgi:hypothetical protein
MSKFIKHIAGPYEGHMQFCLICGEVICDYRRAMYPADCPPPTGFAEGVLYIQGKNPTSFFSGSLDGILEDGDSVVDCNKIQTLPDL